MKLAGQMLLGTKGFHKEKGGSYVEFAGVIPTKDR